MSGLLILEQELIGQKFAEEMLIEGACCRGSGPVAEEFRSLVRMSAEETTVDRTKSKLVEQKSKLAAVLGDFGQTKEAKGCCRRLSAQLLHQFQRIDLNLGLSVADAEKLPMKV